jgi:hypothetical protein
MLVGTGREDRPDRPDRFGKDTAMARVRPRLNVTLPVLITILIALTLPVASIAADSPARGHAEVIAQGVAVLPPAPVVWNVAHEPVPTAGTTSQLRDLGFVVADGESILVSVEGGGEALLDSGEAAFVAGGAEQTRTGIGQAEASAYAITLATQGQAIEQNDQPVFVGDPFPSPSGKRDLSLVRDVLQEGETGELPMAASGAPVLLLVTSGELAVTGAGETSMLAAGGAAEFTADLTIESLSGPATYAAVVIGAELVPVADSASITVSFFGCPPGVTATDANTVECLPIIGGTGAAIDSESEGILLSLDQAIDNGDGSYTWSDLPFGIYTVTDIVLPAEYDGNYAIRGDTRDESPDQMHVRLSENQPSAHFIIFGLGGLRA